MSQGSGFRVESTGFSVTCVNRIASKVFATSYTPLVCTAGVKAGAVVGVAGVMMTLHCLNALSKWLLARALMRCRCQEQERQHS